ncbi:phosphogluconate dehydrogenase (NAD(+)-dependent, decarboxylating) [Acidothermus cellulolyticus]|nr:decarboxylating 6-phosphogluconate dehydrogenase [Acidothermus cellulolyticus]
MRSGSPSPRAGLSSSRRTLWSSRDRRAASVVTCWPGRWGHMTSNEVRELGIVGLGRMGANIARRVMRAGHRCVVYDVREDAVRAVAEEGAAPAASLAELVEKLSPPRAVWVMLPAGEVTGEAIDALGELLLADDTIIDGGNSYYRDDVRRAAALAPRGIHFVDCGTSGGVWGLERGYCLMIGGEAEVVSRLRPIFAALAPGVSAAPRTPARSGTPSDAEHGFLHCGPVGAGHFVKMVHNGIEYGMMAALAEGLNILHSADIGKHHVATDAETAPIEFPEFYRYEFDVAEVAEVWRRGSVIQSWLLDLTADALARSPELAEFGGRVSDSGEGRWTAIAAVEEGVPAPVLTTALYSRFASRGLDDFANKILSAMRKGFGGHEEKPG